MCFILPAGHPDHDILERLPSVIKPPTDMPLGRWQFLLPSFIQQWRGHIASAVEHVEAKQTFSLKRKCLRVSKSMNVCQLRLQPPYRTAIQRQLRKLPRPSGPDVPPQARVLSCHPTRCRPGTALYGLARAPMFHLDACVNSAPRIQHMRNSRIFCCNRQGAGQSPLGNRGQQNHRHHQGN